MFDLKKTRLACCEISLPLAADDKKGLLEYLPPQLKSVASKRIEQFLAGRWCAIKASEKLGLIIDEVGIGPDRSPIWPDEIVGSISHTKKYAISVVGKSEDYLSVGVDVEEIIDSNRFGDIASKVVTKIDQDLLISSKNKEMCGTIVFSAKESLYKCLNPIVGMYIGFLEASVHSIDFENRAFEIELHSNIEQLNSWNKKYSGSFFEKDNLIGTMIYIDN